VGCGSARCGYRVCVGGGEQQVPFEDDNKESKSKYNSKCNSNSVDAKGAEERRKGREVKQRQLH
jgi:hypothetical protein